MKKIIVAISMALSFVTFARVPFDYQLKSALEKQNIIMQNLGSNSYTDQEILSQKNPNPLAMLKLFSVKELAKSFTNSSDEFQNNKVKLIHTYGSVAKVQFKITHPSPFTGLFQSGAPGVLRLSLAQLGEPYTPGLALKLFVDKEISQNIFAMYALEGQGTNYNFFANHFETKISDPVSTPLKLLAVSFKQTLVELGSTHEDPTFQSVNDLSKMTTRGELVERPISPYSLIFVGTREAQMPSSKGDLRIRLKSDSYHPGLVLYKVYARESAESVPFEIGEVILESKFVANQYGDTLLYFRHNID